MHSYFIILGIAFVKQFVTSGDPSFDVNEASQIRDEEIINRARMDYANYKAEGE